MTYSHDILVRTEVRLPTAIIGILLALVGAMGNGAVLYILLCGPKSPMTSSKLLVIVLAVVDFITCAFLIPIELADMITGFQPGSSSLITESYCKVCAFFSLYIACVKFHIVLLISMERYILICQPFRASTLLELPKVSKAITVIMVVALGSALPLPIKFVTIGAFKISGTDVEACTRNYEYDNTNLMSWQVYYMTMFILYYLVPLMFASCAYSFIFKTLYEGPMSSLRGEPSTEESELRIKLAKLMLSIAIVFAVLNSPHFLMTLLITFRIYSPDNLLFITMVLNYLLALNSIINPFLYCSHTKSFFKRQIAALFRSENHTSDKINEDQTERF